MAVKNLSLYKPLVKQYKEPKASIIYTKMKAEGAPSTKPAAIAKSKASHPTWYKKG